MRGMILVAIASMLLFPSCQRSDAVEAGDVLYLRYADNQPEDYPTSKAGRYFASLVDDMTGGRVVIDVYAGGTLGDEPSVLEQMRYGGIDFARCSLGILSDFYPDLAFMTLPFLYDDTEHMWRVLDSEIGDELLTVTQDSSVFGLAWFDAGARSFYTRNPVYSLADMEGLRIRVQETDLMTEIFELLNVVPVKIPYGDVYSALQKLMVDGAENNFPSYYHTGHYETAKYVFLDEHLMLPEMLMMSVSAKEKLDEFDPDLYPVIVECARQSGLYERVLWAEEEKRAKEACLESGCVIYYPSDEEKDEFRKAMAPIYEEFSEYGEIIERIRSM